ncbi:hypothetical protein ACFTAO_45210 [Paenibacillus rhizoplanae]
MNQWVKTAVTDFSLPGKLLNGYVLLVIFLQRSNDFQHSLPGIFCFFGVVPDVEADCP